MRVVVLRSETEDVATSSGRGPRYLCDVRTLSLAVSLGALGWQSARLGHSVSTSRA